MFQHKTSSARVVTEFVAQKVYSASCYKSINDKNTSSSAFSLSQSFSVAAQLKEALSQQLSELQWQLQLQFKEAQINGFGFVLVAVLELEEVVLVVELVVLELLELARTSSSRKLSSNRNSPLSPSSELVCRPPPRPPL